jgi:hypothetical protein
MRRGWRLSLHIWSLISLGKSWNCGKWVGCDVVNAGMQLEGGCMGRVQVHG